MSETVTRKLKVLNSSELPAAADRDSNYIYFAYDKMQLYLGHNGVFSDPFCIVEKMPDKPIESMLYILNTDGSVKSYFNYTVVDIATIESNDQIDILKKAGTVYFQKAEYRYIDYQSKRLVLPYQNGSYQLNVSLDHDIAIDDDTLIRYNSTKKKFEIVGHTPDDDTYGANLNGYKSENTDSIITTIENSNTIKAEAIIANQYDNIIHSLDNGLYASVKDKASQKDLYALTENFNNSKKEIEESIKQVTDTMETASKYISDEYVKAQIATVINNYHADMDNLINNYNAIYEQLGTIQSAAIDYFQTQLTAIKKEITTHIESISSSWDYFSSNHDSTTGNEYTKYTAEELSILDKAINEANLNIILLRKSTGTYTANVNYYLTTDSSGVDTTTPTYISIKNTLTLNSEPASAEGYSHITVSPNVASATNKYLYKVIDDPTKAPNIVLNQDLTPTDYLYWNGKDDLKLANGVSIIIIETSSSYKALKYGVISSVSSNTGVFLKMLSLSEASTDTTVTISCNTAKINQDDYYMYLTNPVSYPNVGTFLSSDYSIWNTDSNKFTKSASAFSVIIAECNSTKHVVAAGTIVIPAK